VTIDPAITIPAIVTGKAKPAPPNPAHQVLQSPQRPQVRKARAAQETPGDNTVISVRHDPFVDADTNQITIGVANGRGRHANKFSVTSAHITADGTPFRLAA